MDNIRIVDGVTQVKRADQTWAEFEAAPVVGESLADVVAEKREAVQAEKCRARDAGFVVDGVLFDSDKSARISYAEMALQLAANPGFKTPWKASAGKWVTMDAALFQRVQAVGADHLGDVFAWQEAKDAEVDAILAGKGTDAEKIAAIQAVTVEFQKPVAV